MDTPTIKQGVKTTFDTFTRTINSQNYYYEKGVLKLFTEDKETKFINKLKVKDVKDKDLNKIITMDTETREVNGIMEAICISYFDGENIKSFKIVDYKTSGEMIINAFESLLDKRYHGYKVYFHNFAKFDGMFILKHLTTMDITIKPIMRDGQIIKLTLHTKDNIELTILDSYLLIPFHLIMQLKHLRVRIKLFSLILSQILLL